MLKFLKMSNLQEEKKHLEEDVKLKFTSLGEEWIQGFFRRNPNASRKNVTPAMIVKVINLKSWSFQNRRIKKMSDNFRIQSAH